MQSLRFLGFIAGGAFFVAVAYGAIVGDTSVDLDFDEEGGEHGRHSITGDRAEFVLSNDDKSVRAKWRGSFDLSDDGNMIAGVDRSMVIEIEKNGVVEKVEFWPKDDGVKRKLWRDGNEVEGGAETDAAIERVVLEFLRTSGDKAEERVAIILDDGGANAVIDEIAQLTGDDATRRYVKALVEQGALEPGDLAALMAPVAEIEGDHDLRHTISAIVETQNLTPEIAETLLSLANEIESDHDLRKLVEVFAETKMDESSLNLALDLLQQIDSDHDLRKSIEALLENDGLTALQKSQIITAAGERIQSDHDIHVVLDEVADHLNNDLIADAWFESLSRISSDNDKRKVISNAAQTGRLSGKLWSRLIESVGQISSDHDKRMALETIAEHMPNGAAYHRAYRDVAAEITSESDREEALAALGEH